MSTPQSVQAAAADLDVMRWNGVALEQTSTDEIDVNAQCNAALQNLLAKLKACLEPTSRSALQVERIEMKTGNDMLDQCQPYYVGVAFSSILSYCAAMPDPPASMRRPRH